MIVSQQIAQSASRTLTEIFEQEFNNCKAAQFIIDITAGVTVSDTVIIGIDCYDPASKSWYNILTSTVLTAIGTTILRVGLDYNAEVNLTAVDFLARKYRIVVTKNNTTAITYSIGANLCG